MLPWFMGPLRVYDLSVHARRVPAVPALLGGLQVLLHRPWRMQRTCYGIAHWPVTELQWMNNVRIARRRG